MAIKIGWCELSQQYVDILTALSSIYFLQQGHARYTFAMHFVSHDLAGNRCSETLHSRGQWADTVLVTQATMRRIQSVLATPHSLGRLW